ncbi:hypothetical protein MSG28_001221 [Choristoneura fumiferana]|uniref:Uncharacterized protein n=1 Tax=Choristoneura fumiferana TaxID=7141 RepID=A0ACC0K4Q2_CHOFU|nr:hypothetical protein MSG28_001221 [Choristoneura fumiferana]
MEDIRTATQLISKDSYMATIDLKDAYFLVPVHANHRKYLRFRFDKLYQFTCLPFGLCSAPYVFTKLVKPILTHLRNKGHTLVAYLDDILCMGDTYSNCLNTVNAVINTLQRLGFVVNYEKSKPTPSKVCKFLGFILNSNSMTLELPKDKKEKIFSITRQISRKKEIKIREFARFTGTLTAACPAVKYGWLHTKLFEREKFLALLNHSDNYEAKMKLCSSLKSEFDWWISCIGNIDNPIRKSHFIREIYTDSSLSGWGAFSNGETARGYWSQEESNKHINHLELLAAFLGLKTFCKNLQNAEILLRIDNTTAIAYINRMGGIQFPHLNKLASEIWNWCEERNLFIYASYIKSKENVEADRASRITNIDTEWELKNSCFQFITKKLGHPNIDLFATRINKKCDLYVSWKRDPEAFDIDAFTLRWTDLYFYAFPPFSLIMKCLRKIINDEATGILVVPYWPEPLILCGQTLPGVREVIREAFLKKSLQDSTIDIMIKSLSNSTLQQYNTAYKQWVQFCNTNKIDWSETTTPVLLGFLTQLFEKGASYGTLNSTRSALSLIFGKQLCNNDYITRFFKGIFKIKPNLPKYQFTWDPSKVLSFLSGLYPNESLSILALTKKLVTLLALSTGHRVQTLSVIKANNITINDMGAIIIVDGIIKTSGPNRNNPKLVLPHFVEKNTICPVKTLSSYITRMEQFRAFPNTEKLILTTTQPHHNASAQSISRWIKIVLRDSGVDVSVFTAHSTRHAATSAAYRAGVSIDLIKRTAGWTNSSKCFAKFYNLPLNNDKNDRAFAGSSV